MGERDEVILRVAGASAGGLAARKARMFGLESCDAVDNPLLFRRQQCLDVAEASEKRDAGRKTPGIRRMPVKI